MTLKPTADQPRAVLDTNTVLDWLVFADPCVSALADAVQTGRLRWLTCAPMRTELAHMLGHRSLARWSPDAPAALALFDHLSLACATPAARAPASLRCSDADDQVFIDLALAQQAQWLLTHDRAVLRLARPAARLGLLIARPGDWERLSGRVICT